MTMLDRRLFLQGSSAGLLASALGPGIAFAQAPTDKIFILMNLRGGLDALHTLVPYADKDYLSIRPRLAIRNPLKLGGYFGLNPALKGLHGLYKSGELALIPAISTSYRQRSHFDGQNFLENGSGRPYGASDGWLNRALATLGDGRSKLGLSLGHQVPLILQGKHRVQTWSDSTLPEVSNSFLASLARVYRTDPVFAKALREARGNVEPDLPDAMRRRANTALNLDRNAKAAAQLLSMKDGPRVAVIESQGWDTHQNQDQRLSKLLGQVDEAVISLKTGLGPQWRKTVVMIVSEFGRTVAENANRGTDHGTGGLVMLAGGAVKGGRVAGDWPGLKGRALHDGRDLKPVNAMESVFKSVLIAHLGVNAGDVANKVFPGNSIRPMDGLLS